MRGLVNSTTHEH